MIPVPITKQDERLTKLRDKVLEYLNEMDHSESLEAIGLSVYEVIDDAIESRLNTMSFDELLEVLL